MWDVIIKVSVGCGVGCGVSSSMKKWPGIHRLRMRDIIARVYGTWSVNVSVNGLSGRSSMETLYEYSKRKN